jgi:hypothetical protein
MINHSGVRIINFAISKGLTMFLHAKIHKYTWMSPYWKMQNEIYYVLMDRRRHTSAFDLQ